MDLKTLGIWCAALMTLFIYSFIFVDNPFYKFAEHAYVGVAAAYGMVLQIDNMIRPTVKNYIGRDGKYYLIIPIILGLLIYTRYFKSISYLSRYCVSFMVGVGAGVVLARDFRSSFVVQLTDTMRPISGAGAIENLVVMIGVVTTLTYFFFTLEHKGFIGVTAKIGRFTMMVALGAAFGNTVMARVSLFLGRVQFLLGDWLHIL